MDPIALAMQLLKATLLSYAAQHLPSLPFEYSWKFDANVVKQAFAVTVNGSSWYDQTRALKRGMSKQWTAAPARRGELADYAVRVWGGVKRNGVATMQGYVQTVSTGKVPATYKGVASWSKVAAFADPAKHAIFDARVSFSLNAIQLLLGDGQCWWFPHLAGQNTLLKATWPVLRARAKQQGWTRVAPTEVYSRYIELLQCVAGSTGKDIDDVEMLLFSKAEELANAVNFVCAAP